MTTLIAATGASAWILLVGAAIAGLAFGMILNSLIDARRKKK
jgi:hypothetical protein